MELLYGRRYPAEICRVRHMNIYCVMQKIKLVWICFLRRCQGKRSKMYRGKDERGLYRDKDFVFKNKSTNANQNTRSSVRTGRECVRKTDIFTGSCGKGLSRQKEEGLVTFKKNEDKVRLSIKTEIRHIGTSILKIFGRRDGRSVHSDSKRGSQHIQCRYAVRTGIV